MFVTILLVHSCILALVKSNPLRGFASYPVIQYQESYRNEQPIFVQPSDFSSYPHLHLIQNQVSPYENNPIPYDSLVQEIYLENILRNRINSGIDTNYDQNGGQIRWYVNPPDTYVPNAVNNYIIEPVEYNDKNNKSKDRNTRTSKCKTRVNGKSASEIINNDQKKKNKCRKRKSTSRNINHENKEKCSSHKEINQDVKDNEINKQPPDQDVKVCTKKKSRTKPHSRNKPKEKESSTDSEKLAEDKNSKLDNSQNTNKKNLNKICDNRVKNDKNKSNKCRSVTKKDDSYDLGRILEIDDYFDIKEGCAKHDARCTRNYKEESIQKYQQQYHIPSDFTNNMASYMVFNPQSFNTNGYFPHNFDYLYNMQKFANENSNLSQKKPKNYTRTGRRKKQRKSNKKNCDRNKQDSKRIGGCEKNEELSSTAIIIATDHEPTSTTTAKIDKTQIKITYQDVQDINREEKDVTLGTYDDSKESAPNDRFDSNQKAKDLQDSNLEDPSPVYDDYYPTFYSDNVYTSKEEFDWDNFNDRNYYSSTDISELGRERRKYDSINDVPITYQGNIIKSNNLKSSTQVKIHTNDKVNEPFRNKVNSKEEKDSIKQKTSSEETQFRTPPSLDFPDFKTRIINKETHIPTAEIYYQPNDKNKFRNSKMSTYSNTKKAESNETRNKIVDQNDVETVFGHSKVVKYGAPPNNGEVNSDIIDSSDSKEDNPPHSTDGKTTIIIAKSLPYPIT